TDKSVYTPGETVTVNVATEETGDLIVTTTTGYSATIALAGPTNFNFALPDAMASGTQSIKHYLGENIGSCRFDVLGYSLKVTNVMLDKETYDPIDRLSAVLTVKSNTALPVVVKGWLYTPEGSYTELFEVIRDLASGESEVDVSSSMSTTVAGTHKLVYGIYSSGTNLTLVTGSKAFDVRPTAIIAVTTDKETYNESDEVQVTVQTYSCGDYTGSIEIVHGGEVIATTAVTLNGPAENVITIGPLFTGIYQLSARLKNETETASEKPFEVAVIDMNAPSSPTGLTLAMDGVIAGLSWNPNTEPDIAGYNAYGNDEKYNAIPFKACTFRREGLVAGITYTFHVTAIDKAGNESPPSASVTAQIDNIAPVISMTPSGNVTSNVPVTLTYSVSDDIDPSPTVDASHESGITFSGDDTYEITIVATDASGNRAMKAISIVIETGAPDPVAIAAADGKTGGTVLLDWAGYNEAPDVVAYRIYQRETAFTSIEGIAPIASIENGTFTYKATGLTNGTRYHFAVVAVDRFGNAEPLVTSASAVPTDGKGAVKVLSSALGSRVYLGGTYAYPGAFAGDAPCKATALPEGPYVVQIIAPGYEKFYRMVEVVSGDTVTIDAAIQPGAGFGYTTGVSIAASGVDLNFGRAAKPVVADWNMDGKKDLLGIDADNNLVAWLNGGSDETPVFTSPAIPVLECAESDYAFCLVDFNNDFLIDIIFGKTDGSLAVRLNSGTPTAPLFSSEAVVLPAKVSGNAVPAVVDWNNDGRKDLLVGDLTGAVKVFLNTGSGRRAGFQHSA
ncbi:MAG: VCBS repeat-containing protein, partial [Chitinispirillaceae bacterium]|nr:VCBS repeat-containing protein [Chitinispirillaceae bacterium]